MRFGGLEFIVILIIFMLAVGWKMLPRLTRSIKDSMNEFKADDNATEELDSSEETK